MVRNAYCKTDGVLRLWGLLPTVCVFHFRGALFVKTYLLELATREGTVNNEGEYFPRPETCLRASGTAAATKAAVEGGTGAARKGRRQRFQETEGTSGLAEGGAMRESVRVREAGPLCWVKGAPSWISKENAGPAGSRRTSHGAPSKRRGRSVQPQTCEFMSLGVD